MKDGLLGAKSQPTVMKRLMELDVRVYRYGMVKTLDLFEALLPERGEEFKPYIEKERPQQTTKPFRLRR